MNQDEIMRSIVVQGSILDSNTEYYEKMAMESETREYSNPVEKAISAIFRLCLDGSIDPWDINLRSFTRIFSDLVGEDFRDFGTAGLIMYQAWRILNEKSTESIEKRIRKDLDEADVIANEGEEIPFNDPVEISFSAPVRHHEKRRVFLVELLDAMREAYSNRHRERKPPSFIEINPETHNIDEIVSELHAEEPESEIARVGQIIDSDARSEIPMEQIWDTPEFSRQSFFVYCMFLMRERRIKLIQQDHYGAIMIQKPL